MEGRRERPDLCFVAVKRNDLKLLKNAFSKGFELSIDCRICATLNDQHDILQFLIENNCPWIDDLCFVAAQRDDLTLLKRAYRKGFKLTEKCSTFAAMNNQIEMLKFLLENNCPCSDSTYKLATPLCLKYLRTMSGLSSFMEKAFIQAYEKFNKQ